ncbi:GNAT family N-acetyltransferase [Cognatiyoonia sp. IB215446]|uniref:GNAT family N-acetyltransferase n=1 Tax=Cognatiyoonia sp. IB215446 TaxID=3097355 RepID=UPI002A10A2C3|nr:GNAT family N-acetyltransferase [Cognatiyoonia sp. IB215446]MDX8349208.1 GNAT family N-acetyltransferase [Cognatiyoonia sp. IB215446]
MIDARPVTLQDVVPLHDVTVRDDQDRFVAPNAITIAQARFETGAYDFCLWDGDIRVGLIALIDMAEHEDLEEIDDPEAVYVWRLLIGKDFQQQGHGKAAMDFAEDWARERGRRCVQIQAVEDNMAAIAMYQALGYTLTGHKSGKEVQLEKVL